MKNKSADPRIPREVGSKALPTHPALKTPWEKLISFHDAYHYACRHNSVVGAAFMQVMRIIIPDYATRCKRLCDDNYNMIKQVFSSPFGKMHADNHCVHHFMRGGYIAALFGDSGDERLLMPGRVTDYGPYRAEKELDACYWDIVGSEICRVSVYVLEGIGECYRGPSMEYSMVESKGCGDLHCRIVAENRDKYPMPKRECWDNFGPVATADQIKFTPEDKMLKEPQQFRPECGYKYRNGLNAEFDADHFYANGGASHALGSDYVTLVLENMIKNKEITREEVGNVIKCVFEASGKMAFGDFFAVKGLRDWLGVPGDVNDGRVLGGLIEVVLQAILADYTIQRFDEEEVVYDIKLAGLERRMPLLTTAYFSMWYGMTKTLVGAQWSLWHETEGVSDETLRIKIAKKIDKYC